MSAETPSLLICTRADAHDSWIALLEAAGASVARPADNASDFVMAVAAKPRTWKIAFVHSPEELSSCTAQRAFDVWALDDRIDWTHNILRLLRDDQREWRRSFPHPCRMMVAYFNRVPTTREVLGLGRLGIGAAIYEGAEENAVEAILRLSNPAPAGKKALCLAGGGIEGLIYEIGVLRALDEILPGQGVLDFDIYCGISAGAIIASVLANHAPPLEITRAFLEDSTMMKGIKPWMLFDLAFSDVKNRLASLALHPGDDGILSWIAGSIPNAFFMGNNIERILADFFRTPGRTDSFHQLDRELYIGATDQDTSDHVVFGGMGWRDVPISRAVHASMALIPFYAPQYIAGRWFIDGSFTRTSEMEVAIAKGATLVVIVDPLVPVRAMNSGFVRGRGGVYAGIQGLKALVNTRFLGALPHVMNAHPEVDFLVFMPEEEDMRILSGSPLRYRYRMEIERIAHDTALERIRRNWAQVVAMFQRHGMVPEMPPGPAER